MLVECLEAAGDPGVLVDLGRGRAADDDGADAGQRQDVAHRLVQREPSRPSSAPWAQTFMPMTPMPRRAASGSTVRRNESRWTSAALSATSTVSKSNRRIASSRMAGSWWPVMPRNRTRPSSRAWSSASIAPPRAKIRSRSSHGPQVVQLPEVEVVGPQPPQALVEQPERAVAGAVVGLGGEEDLAAALAEGGPVVVEAGGVGRRGVAVVDPLVEGAVDHLDGLRRAAVGAQDALAAQAEERRLVAGPAERGWRGGGAFRPVLRGVIWRSPM